MDSMNLCLGDVGVITDFTEDHSICNVKFDTVERYTDSWNFPTESLEKYDYSVAQEELNLERNGFRPYTKEETEALCKIIDRAGFEPDLEKLEKNLVRFEHLGDFTTCAIIDHTGELFVGVSKRVKGDKPNPKVGEIMALKRAVMESGNAN